MTDKIKTNDELNPDEERLADLLFQVKDDEEFVNTIMMMADYDDIIVETADYIEANPICTESDILKFMASFVTMVFEDD